ncbi:MAG TPA: radical SAM/SPASM family putative metalloenzyme maturase [Dissulfurispiraceae bacterium]|nr:radical SAM/SPASM family putative metalloenzyme maturase [Dissulfurispiraceae bacterium]
MDNRIQSEQQTVGDIEDRAFLPYPSRLFVEVTTRCNLRCAMCSKHSPGNGIIDGDLSAETFSRIVPALARLDALVLNGIGEPLMHPQLEGFIETARREMPFLGSIGFQTNGQLIDRQRAESLVAAGADRICVSSDAVSPDIFRLMRNGGNQKAVENAVTQLHEASVRQGRRVALGLEFVVTKRNVRELPRLLRWAALNSVGFVIVTHMLPYQAGMSDAVAFDINTDSALQHFRQWKDRAAADGVDIERYFDVFMKFHKTPEEEQVTNYVRKMIADATSKGIDLNIDNLLKCDEEMLNSVREAFAEADEIARASGIDLHLPALVPSRTRKCEFVANGSAFISWDGDVHPCYFLWHRYNCHLGGVVKCVQPEAFGNLAEQDMLSIWNGPKFRAFREGVSRYDFPFCYDCSVALCDYVQLADFTQDCYVSPVPCGACLWCTGLFRCLQ